jgi:hypothetical protein
MDIELSHVRMIPDSDALCRVPIISTGFDNIAMRREHAGTSK